MPEFPRKDFRLHVGWRTIKTAVSAMLVAIVYCLIGRNPAFACIGVIAALLVNYFLPRPGSFSSGKGSKARSRKTAKSECFSAPRSGRALFFCPLP